MGGRACQRKKNTLGGLRGGGAGHLIANCPHNTDRSMEPPRPRSHVGIPTSFLKRVEDASAVGALINAEGTAVVMQPNECVRVVESAERGSELSGAGWWAKAEGCLPVLRLVACPWPAMAPRASACGVANDDGALGAGAPVCVRGSRCDCGLLVTRHPLYLSPFFPSSRDDHAGGGGRGR